MIQIGSPDPAPSRLRYRLERHWYSPAFRRATKIGIPLAAVALALFIVAQYRDVRGRVAVGASAAVGTLVDLAQMPEFRVDALDVTGASPEVEAVIREIFDVELPQHSFRLDVERLRRDILRVPAVESATLRLRSGGVIEVRIRERIPVAIWRHEFGLALVDLNGRRIGSLDSRSERKDLPLIAGDGAPDVIREALELYGVAQPFAGRVRGLRRVGERRWDFVLNNEQTIKLPESGAAGVLKRIAELHLENRLLDRFVTVVDFRLPDRPVLRVEHDKFRTGDETRPGRYAGRAATAEGT